jgi:phosphomannomutase
MSKVSFKPGTMIYPLPAVMVSCGETPEEYNIITIGWVGTICSEPSETDKKLHQFMAKEVQKTPAEEKLELKIKKLEDELKREQFKTLALNTMINIAERELKVDIRKKPGAKR